MSLSDDAPVVEQPARAPIATESKLGEIHVLALIDHLVLGGAEMLMGQLAEAAPRAGIRLSVSCLFEMDGNPAAAGLSSRGVVPVDLSLPARPSLRSLRAVRRHIGEVRPDIVHTHLGSADLLGGVAARTLGIPAVSTIHTTVWSSGARAYIRLRLVRAFTTRMVAVSEAARRACLERGFARPDQIVTIRNGVTADAMPGSGRELRRELGWRDDDLVVGMLSALRAIKAHDVAVESFRQLIEDFPNLRLLIVGRGREWDRISELTRDLGDRVAMVGHRQDVMRCLDAFDVCLHPSYDEALPTTLIEAMAARVPVLATAVGGVPEVIMDGLTGVLIPAPPAPHVVAEMLAALLRDQPRRQALAAAARQRYEEQFTAGPWIQSVRALYDDLLNKRRTHGVGARQDALRTSPDQSGVA